MMDNSKKRGLGKGLSALIPKKAIFAGGRTIVNIDIGKIYPNPRQPRTEFPKDALKELSDSIKEQGVIEPILTRMRAGRYELVAGERRWRAAKLAGLTLVPSIIKDFTDEQSLEIALIENLQREDLNPMDEAEGYALLIKEFKITQEQVAKKVGKNRSTVTNMLRVLTLPDKIKQSLRKEEISVGHARALLAISDQLKQLEAWKQIISSKLNVRDVEILVSGKSEKQKARKGGRKRAFTKNAELNALVERLTTFLGTKVKILGTPQKGRIEINYFSKEDLERVLEIIFRGKKTLSRV
ncbi:MAG: ParB/RepB/Spo0J family partition protein [Candidatus Margulisiibacteriota bacterium]|nr:ParB/RepB/Spo0J family partition protein [Candidatus Margulisiibacteriota bacterium]